MGGLDPAGKAVGDTCVGSEPGGVHTAPPSAPRNPQCDHSPLLGRGRVSFQGPPHPCLHEQYEAAGMGVRGRRACAGFCLGFPALTFRATVLCKLTGRLQMCFRQFSLGVGYYRGPAQMSKLFLLFKKENLAKPISFRKNWGEGIVIPGLPYPLPPLAASPNYCLLHQLPPSLLPPPSTYRGTKNMKKFEAAILTLLLTVDVLGIQPPVTEGKLNWCPGL